MIKWVIALRVKEYIKNILIIFPAFFAGQISKLFNNFNLIGTILVFCVLASAVYLVNDIFDIKLDSQHPVKKNKPITKGEIKKEQALILAVLLITIGLSISYFISLVLFKICITYLIINLIYSSFAKHIPLAEILIITTGFILRIAAGGTVANVEVSEWLYFMVFIISIGFALSKRLEEIYLLKNLNISVVLTRPVLKYYPKTIIQSTIILLMIFSFINYCLYTVSEETIIRLKSNNIYLTSILAFIGLTRYIYLIIHSKTNISPIKIIVQDKLIIATILIWLISMSYIIYY